MKRFETAELAMVVFIASEAVFFAFLIAAYIYYSGATVRGPQAGNSLDPSRTLLFTICLLASSGTLWLAERRLAAGSRNGFKAWLGVTVVLGSVFLAGQAFEYSGLISKNITPARNLFAATFFTLTGFHGFHVFCGLIALSVLLLLASMDKFGEKAVSGVGAISIYWHFVDAVWVLIFSLVYLAVWV